MGFDDEMLPLSQIGTDQLVVVGAPIDVGSSFLAGCAQGPRALREALRSPASNLCSEDGTDLSQIDDLVLGADFDLSPDGSFVEQLERQAAALLHRGAHLLTVGGDHAITAPLVRAHRSHHPDLEILHLDAHPDLYDSYEGNRLSHASPFARILEEGLASRLLQVGIRTMNPHQRQQAERFGVEVVEMRHWSRAPSRIAELRGPIYLSVDLDVLDPAYAPGVSHREPGGASVRQVLDLLQRLEAPVVGADIVELNPGRDTSGTSAMVVAKLVKEMVALMLRGPAAAAADR